jgi:RNase P protein component
MLLRTYRLRSKEVRYLTKKRQYFGKGLFGFYYIKQYPNLPFHQFSFHVTIKLSKHATKRNFVKRIVMKSLRDQHTTSLAICGQFYKLFIVLNKNELLYSQQLFQEKKKAELQSYIVQAFQSSFTLLYSFLCSKK